MKSQTLRTDIVSIVAGILLMICLYFFDPSLVEEVLYAPRNQVEQVDSTAVTPEDPTPGRVLIYLSEIGVEHPEIVTAQAIVETGWFRCSNCSLDFNNIFGFRVGGEYLQFENWKQSCDYYLAWQQNRYAGGDYYDFLRLVGYAVDSLYEEKIRDVASTVRTQTHP
jgi:hypothetical protein